MLGWLWAICPSSCRIWVLRFRDSGLASRGRLARTLVRKGAPARLIFGPPPGFVRVARAENPRAGSDESDALGFVRVGRAENPRVGSDESGPGALGKLLTRTHRNPQVGVPCRSGRLVSTSWLAGSRT